MAKAPQEAPKVGPTPDQKEIASVIVQHHLITLTERMKQWRGRNQVPPVLLLTGLPGIGKNAVAQFLGRWILCEKSGFGVEISVFTESDLKPCEICSTCQRTRAGNEVDLIKISSDTDEDGTASAQSLKIEQFRKLKASAGFSAHSSHSKIIIISDVDRMTPQAANSMLKLLEEPPKGWIFLMTTHDPTLLLPTLVSRCQIVRLKPFTSAQVTQLLLLSEVESKRAAICAAMAQGSWQRASRFAENDVWEKRKEVFRFLENPTGSLQSLIDWSTESPGNFDLLVDLLEQITSDLIQWSGHFENQKQKITDTPSPTYPWLHADYTHEQINHCNLLSQKLGGLHQARLFWFSQAERLAKIRHELTLPMNRKLLIQDLLLPWVAQWTQKIKKSAPLKIF